MRKIHKYTIAFLTFGLLIGIFFTHIPAFGQSENIDYDRVVVDGEAVTLRWEHNMANTAGFRFYRAFEDVPASYEAQKEVLIPNLEGDVTVWLPANSEGRIYFRVSAFNTSEESPKSNYVSMLYSNLDAPTQPINLRVIFEGE